MGVGYQGLQFFLFAKRKGVKSIECVEHCGILIPIIPPWVNYSGANYRNTETALRDNRLTGAYQWQRLFDGEIYDIL